VRRRHLAFLLAAVLALGGCGSSSSSNEPEQRDASDLTGEFDDETVDAAVDLLASSGVPVRTRPRDSPLVDVDDPGPLSMLRFQVRNLALEANRGGGTLGADLDALTEAAGGAPASYLVAGWARAGATPAAAVAAELLGDLDTTDPSRLAISGLVLALFLGDITGGGTTADAPVASGWRRAAPRSAGDEDGDFCAEVAAYLSASLEDVLDPDLELEPRWLQDAIDFYVPWETDPQRVRTAVGALALLVYATSISRPWVPLLVANPLGDVHHRVGSDATAEEAESDDLVSDDPLVEGDEIAGSNELRLAVDVGEGSFAEEAAECAALAGVGLTEHEAEGSGVLWLVQGLLPHMDGGKGEGDLELDENANAVFEYKPVGESADDHRDGVLNTAVIPVAVVIERAEIDELRDVVESLLTGGDLGVAAGEVAATYARLDEQLTRLLYPRATTSVTMTWHTPEPPRERCGEGCAASNGDPHLIPVSGPDYDFQAAGEYTLLRSAGGEVEIQARQQPAAGSTTVAITTAVAARVGDRRVGIYRRDAGVELTVDGEALAVAEPIDLGDGGRLSPYESGVEVTFPDGTVMWVVAANGDRLDVVISASDPLRTTGQGLLGPATDDGYGLPLLPDGTSVSAPDDEDEAFDLLYGEFGAAWQVTDDRSLFDYAAGESAASFVVDGFPSRPLTYDDLTADQLALGEEACAEVAAELLRRQCVFDVAVTGDPSFAETYLMIGAVIAEAAAGLGEPGPVSAAAPAAEGSIATTPPVSGEVIEGRPTTTATPAPAAEPQAGSPSVTLAGELVASWSEQASDEAVVTALHARVRVEEGSVLLMRTDDCPGDATVFTSVSYSDSGAGALPFLCDPAALRGYLVDEGDELIDGEVYVWVPAAGELDIVVDTDAETPVPIEIEVFSDPSPTIVSGDELVSAGHSATLSGIGDTVVYDFTGDAATSPPLQATGLDVACAVEAYGAERPGTAAPWALGICDHSATAGSGLASSGVAVPLVVFSRTDGDIAVEFVPGE
jgi:hypothetical protein